MACLFLLRLFPFHQPSYPISTHPFLDMTKLSVVCVLADYEWGIFFRAGHFVLLIFVGIATIKLLALKADKGQAAKKLS